MAETTEETNTSVLETRVITVETNINCLVTGQSEESQDTGTSTTQDAIEIIENTSKLLTRISDTIGTLLGCCQTQDTEDTEDEPEDTPDSEETSELTRVLQCVSYIFNCFKSAEEGEDTEG